MFSFFSQSPTQVKNKEVGNYFLAVMNTLNRMIHNTVKFAIENPELLYIVTSTLLVSQVAASQECFDACKQTCPNVGSLLAPKHTLDAQKAARQACMSECFNRCFPK